MQAGIVQFREQRGTDFQEIEWNIWMWKKVKIQGFWLGKYAGLFFLMHGILWRFIEKYLGKNHKKLQCFLISGTGLINQQWMEQSADDLQHFP